jgi:hypothetical protein
MRQCSLGNASPQTLRPRSSKNWHATTHTTTTQREEITWARRIRMRWRVECRSQESGGGERRLDGPHSFRLRRGGLKAKLEVSDVNRRGIDETAGCKLAAMTPMYFAGARSDVHVVPTECRIPLFCHHLSLPAVWGEPRNRMDRTKQGAPVSERTATPARRSLHHQVVGACTPPQWISLISVGSLGCHAEE